MTDAEKSSLPLPPGYGNDQPSTVVVIDNRAIERELIRFIVCVFLASIRCYHYQLPGLTMLYFKFFDESKQKSTDSMNIHSDVVMLHVTRGFWILDVLEKDLRYINKVLSSTVFIAPKSCKIVFFVWVPSVHTSLSLINS